MRLLINFNGGARRPLNKGDRILRLHKFNIILFKNCHDGKFLTYKDVRWNCFLFPNYHNDDAGIASLKACFSKDIRIPDDVSPLEYIDKMLSEKYSVGDKINKLYEFCFYNAEVSVPFTINYTKYHWLSLEEMCKSKNISQKNGDVLNFVATRYATQIRSSSNVCCYSIRN